MGYYLQQLTPETMKLLRSSKSKITNEENGESIPNLEISSISPFLSCQQRSSTWFKSLIYIFPNKLFGQLLDDQSFKPIEIEDKINIALVIH